MMDYICFEFYRISKFGNTSLNILSKSIRELIYYRKLKKMKITLEEDVAECEDM